MEAASEEASAVADDMELEGWDQPEVAKHRKMVSLEERAKSDTKRTNRR